MSMEISVKEKPTMENEESDGSLEEIDDLISRAEAIIAENRARYRRSMPTESLRDQVTAILRGTSPLFESDYSATEESVREPVAQPPSNNESLSNEDDVIFVACEQIPVIDLSTPNAPSNSQIRSRRRRRTTEDDIITIPDIPSTSINNVNIISPNNENSRSGDLNPNCPICLDTCKQRSSTMCGHVFCKECILAAIRSTHKCPICKRKLNPKSVHPLYI